MIDPKSIRVERTDDPKTGVIDIRAVLVLSHLRKLSEQSTNSSWMKPGELVEIAKRDCRRMIMSEVYGELRNDFLRLEQAIRFAVDPALAHEVDPLMEVIREKLNY